MFSVCFTCLLRAPVDPVDSIWNQSGSIGIHVHIHVHVHIHRHVHIHVVVYLHVHLHVNVHIHAHVVYIAIYTSLVCLFFVVTLVFC